MSFSTTPLLLSPSNTIASSNAIFVDATFFPPGGRNASEEFVSKRLPGARFLDLRAISNKEHPLGLGNMLPTPKQFAEMCGKLGITPEDHVVLYDTRGVFSSPRALFMFRVFGHTKSSVLNGGLPAWEAASLPVETTPPALVQETTYAIPTCNVPLIAEYQDISAHVCKDPQSLEEIVLDARPGEVFARAHMPNSLSLPFASLLTTHSSSQNPSLTYTTFKNPEEIKATLMDTLGTERTEQLLQGKFGAITSCNSGMTASTVLLGLWLLGIEKVRFYDESWEGYSKRAESKILCN